MYCTFLEDFVGTRSFSWWGEKNCMWSSDYPHFNMSFPHSRENVEKHLAGLSAEKRRKLVREIGCGGGPLICICPSSASGNAAGIKQKMLRTKVSIRTGSSVAQPWA